MAEILIFGKRAGLASINFSQKLNHQLRSQYCINNAHENINKVIKKGDELVRPLQHELRNLMWKYCGVIKDEKLLLEGLKEIEIIDEKLNNVDVRIDEYNCEDLSSVLDLESSLICAKATIKSGLERKESRGAHQRSDYPKINNAMKLNYLCELDVLNNNLKVSKSSFRELDENLSNLVTKSSREKNIKNKLLE